VRWLAPACAVAAILGLVSGSGCKERGTLALDLEFPATCEEATHVSVHLARNVTCADCRCEDCLVRLCGAGNCTPVCQGAQCSIEDFERGIEADPPEAGLYAVIYLLLRPRGGGFEAVASACADVEVDSDGTESSEQSVTGTCCGQADAGPGPDAPSGP
jgi:hypothetical protein